MQTVSRSRYVAWLTLFSVGWLSMLFQGVLFDIVTPLCFSAAFLVGLSPEERRRPVPPRELLPMGAFLVVLVLVMIATNVWVPEAINDRIDAVVRTPFFVVPTWILFVALIVIVRRKRERAELEGQACDQSSAG
jgi:hypothetical protein